MKINKPSIQVTGTSLKGYINCSYDDLTKAFGYPLESGFDDFKSDAEWHIQFEDGKVATVYNYKNGKNYLGELGFHACDITQWHIGGNSKEVVQRVADLIPDSVVV